jgi:sec-independent protein translocase protein TatA
MIGSGELIVILCVLLLLFGGKKLPEFARNLGKGIREFKKACGGEADNEAEHATLIESEKSETVNPTQKIKTDGQE